MQTLPYISNLIYSISIFRTGTYTFSFPISLNIHVPVGVSVICAAYSKGSTVHVQILRWADQERCGIIVAPIFCCCHYYYPQMTWVQSRSCSSPAVGCNCVGCQAQQEKQCSKQVSPSCTCSVTTFSPGVPQWPGADTRWRNLPTATTVPQT